uniref:F-box domain-containing protein n=1 Tax=Globisporangium ultimum (strain ATCC 200006 / CBS 805.95 / DAOM BR144) TaxID=431595 RepID=K3WH08_GLOUD
MDFSLPLEAHGVTHNRAPSSSSSSPTSTALIVHPLSLFNTVRSPTCGQDLLIKYNLQLQEMQQLYEQQQRAAAMDADAKPRRRACLLEFTCDENVRSILGYLDGASLAATQRVNRYFHQLSGDDMYWYNLCKAEWAIAPEQLQTRPASYQALYKFACQSLKKMIREFFEEQCLSSMQKSFRIPRDTALMIARRSVF